MTVMAMSDAEPLSKTRLRLWLRLLKLTGEIETVLRRRLRDEHGSTLPRFDVMAALSRNPDGLKMSELSGYLKVSNGNVTGIVDRLTEEGLALRVAVPDDKRSQIARLTPQGHTVFAQMAEAHEAWVDAYLDHLSPDDARALIVLLDKALTDGDRQDGV